MNRITLSRPDGSPITRWEEWTRPKKDCHWTPDRSAMELAKSWFQESTISPPEELIRLLQSSHRLRGIRLLRGVPELVTSLPEKGEGRNHDLWLFGKTDSELVSICIEAKADETFGNETVAEYMASALKRRKRGESTRLPERIERLLSYVPGQQAQWAEIRYQLLTAICGTAMQAQSDHSKCAVFVVHEFQTRKTIQENIQRNARDFDDFLDVIFMSHRKPIDGDLLGPIVICDVDCYIGKIRRNTEDAA